MSCGDRASDWKSSSDLPRLRFWSTNDGNRTYWLHSARSPQFHSSGKVDIRQPSTDPVSHITTLRATDLLLHCHTAGLSELRGESVVKRTPGQQIPLKVTAWMTERSGLLMLTRSSEAVRTQLAALRVCSPLERREICGAIGPSHLLKSTQSYY